MLPWDWRGSKTSFFATKNQVFIKILNFSVLEAESCPGLIFQFSGLSSSQPLVQGAWCLSEINNGKIIQNVLDLKYVYLTIS